MNRDHRREIELRIKTEQKLKKLAAFVRGVANLPVADESLVEQPSERTNLIMNAKSTLRETTGVEDLPICDKIDRTTKVLEGIDVISALCRERDEVKRTCDECRSKWEVSIKLLSKEQVQTEIENKHLRKILDRGAIGSTKEDEWVLKVIEELNASSE